MPLQCHDPVHTGEGGSLQCAFVRLSGFLADTRGVWAHRPFVQRPVALERDHPALSRWLLSLADPEPWEGRPWSHPDAPAVLRAWAAESEAVCRVPGLGARQLDLPRPRGVRARKWEQVCAFAVAALPRLREAVGLVELCSGKAHLGRSLGELTGLPVRVVERDEALCREGVRMARAVGVSMSSTCADVLEHPLDGLVEPGWALLALHACGDLTDRALELDADLVLAAPCCFHRIRGERYLPRSASGRALDLRLGRDVLRLPTAQEVVASPAALARRRREMAYRQGLDLLLRQARGVDRYQGVGSVPQSWLQGDFPAFVGKAAERWQLCLPRDPDWSSAEALGWRRSQEARLLGMPRAIFRRPLELWLALDRALALQERGYRVELVSFCDEAVTPRNLLIVGLRSRSMMDLVPGGGL